MSAVTVYNHYRAKGGVLLASVTAVSETIAEHAFSYLDKPIWRHVIATSVIEGGYEFGRDHGPL